MSINRGFSQNFKEMAVLKLENRGSRPAIEIFKELGISSPTIYKWRRELGSMANMKNKTSNPKNRTPLEKLQYLTEYGALDDPEKGEYLRRNGITEDHLNEWKDQLQDQLSLNQSYKQKSELKAGKKTILSLQKELRRKDKALAEAAALLILKKKADFLWGPLEGEE